MAHVTIFLMGDRKRNIVELQPARISDEHGGVAGVVGATRARVELDPANARDLAEVFGEYTEDFEFSRTRTIVRLFAIGTEFVSRSEAKRLVRGLERFREVVIDFEGVALVGQGFADEVFRVWSTAHPEVRLIPVGMEAPVAFMVERARRAGATGRSG
jgi:hypothetical protein